MSERNMLKMMMSVLTASLLAITLAATTVHAGRLDQFLSSAADDGRVPYYVCQMFCPGSCTCDRAARPISRCICTPAGDSINSKKPAALLHTSAGIVQVKGNSKENSVLIPWTECHETCDKCACTKMLPVESNWCTCLNDPAPKKAAAAVAVKKVNAVLFPLEECDKNCNSNCACILIWPPPKYCSCFDPIQPKAKCSENCEGVCVCDSPENCSCSTDDIKLSKNPKVKSSALMSVSECMQSCNGVCGCGLIFPPETNVCHCFDTIKSSKKAVPKVKSGSLIPIDECSEKCNVHCACAAIYPPPEYCFCSDPKSLAM